jgi:hypothetical protein
MPEKQPDTVPTPGREAAPESPSDPEDGIQIDEDHGTITRREESGVGPGAGESAIVRVTTPVDRTAEAETLLEDSKTEELHPEVDPQSPGGAVRKLEREAAEGAGVVDKAKRAVEEVDRQISGEYERREQPE